MTRKKGVNDDIALTIFLILILAVFLLLVSFFPTDPFSETKEIQCGPGSYHADDLGEVRLGSRIVCTVEFIDPVIENESVFIVFIEEVEYNAFLESWWNNSADGSFANSKGFASLHIEECTENRSFTYLNQESEDLFLVVYGEGDNQHFRLTLVVDDSSTGNVMRVMAGGLFLICLLMYWAAVNLPKLQENHGGPLAGKTSWEKKYLEAIKYNLSVLKSPDEIARMEAIYRLDTIIRMEGTKHIIECDGVLTLINALDSPNKKSFWAILLTIKKIAEAGYVCNVIYDGGAGILALLLKHGKWEINDEVIKELSNADEWYGTTLLNAIAQVRRLTEAQLASNIIDDEVYDDEELIEDDSEEILIDDGGENIPDIEDNEEELVEIIDDGVEMPEGDEEE